MNKKKILFKKLSFLVICQKSVFCVKKLKFYKFLQKNIFFSKVGDFSGLTLYSVIQPFGGGARRGVPIQFGLSVERWVAAGGRREQQKINFSSTFLF